MVQEVNGMKHMGSTGIHWPVLLGALCVLIAQAGCAEEAVSKKRMNPFMENN